MSVRSFIRPHVVRLWFAAAAVAVLAMAVADAAALPADRQIAQYVRRSWTVEQGLPHGSIRGFAQTPDGYLWIATYEGVVRFNGEKFRTFDDSASPLLTGGRANLTRTPDGTLWVAIPRAGVVRSHGGAFERIAPLAGDEVVSSFAAAPDGSVWIGTAGGRLTRITGSEAKAVSLPLGRGPITALAPAADGALWIGTTAGLVRARDGKVERWTSANGLSSDRIVTLLAEGNGSLLIGTASGLDRLEGNTIAHVGGLPVDQVTALRRDRDTNLWVGTYSHGLFRIDAKGDVATYGIADGLLNPTIRAIFEDDEGSLWIGSNGGIEQLRAGAFVTWNKRDGLTDDFARAIFQDRQGGLWVGTANGLHRWENGAWVAVDDERLSGILSIAQSRDGAYWFGTSNGVYRVSGGQTRLFTTAEGLSNNTVRAIHEDRRGDVWFGTDFGVNRIRRDGTVESFAGRGGLGTEYAMAIAETPDGRLWFATGGGLAERDGDRFRLHSAPHALPSNRLLAVVADAAGTVWLATDGDGLLRFRNGRADAVTTRHGLANDKIISIADGGSMLWLGTIRGAFAVDKRELHAVADGAATRLTSRLFDENDGLGSRQCNGAANPAALRTRDGRIWFATARGVSAFTPRLAVPLPARMPVIERITVDGRETSAAALRSVPPGAARIEFEFSGVTFETPERLRFRYRLEGYDDRWIDAGTNRIASYTNLGGGDYRFELQSSRDGVTWRGVALPLELQPHFYETKWFLALCLVATGALLLAVHKARLHLARERARHLETLVEERTHQISEEKERTERALRAAEAAKIEAEEARAEAERHEQLTERALVQAEAANRAKSIFLAATSHELRTPLNAIIGFSDILLEQIGDRIEPRQVRFLQNIHSSGEYLLGHINNILDLSKIEAGHSDLEPEALLLFDVVEGITAVMKGVATMRHIAIDVEMPGNLPMLEVDPTQIKQILYNLVSNAVKFSPDHSTVVVSARHLPPDQSPLGEHSIEIRVRDEGIGIDPSEHQLIFEEFRQAHGPRGERPHGTGLGLALVKRFVAMHRGTIQVDSALGKGSTFSVVLPCRHKPAAAPAAVPVQSGAAGS